MGKKVHEKIRTFKYLFFLLEIKMSLDYFKKIYRAIRDKLVLPMERENIEKILDYSVYIQSMSGKIIPLPTEKIRNPFLDYVPVRHMENFVEDLNPDKILTIY